MIDADIPRIRELCEIGRASGASKMHVQTQSLTVLVEFHRKHASPPSVSVAASGLDESERQEILATIRAAESDAMLYGSSE